MQVITDAGISWTVVRTWKGGRLIERQIKNRKEAPALCPLCSGPSALNRCVNPEGSQMTQKLGFASWEKWALMSVIILGLSSIVVYFNFRVFRIEDGWPYSAVVSFIVLLSFIVTRHIKRNPVTTNFLRSAFVFEILLCAVLCGNVVYSLSVLREMSVAGQNEKEWREAIDSVSKLRGQNNQKEALQQLKNKWTLRVRWVEPDGSRPSLRKRCVLL